MARFLHSGTVRKTTLAKVRVAQGSVAHAIMHSPGYITPAWRAQGSVVTTSVKGYCTYAS